LSTLQVGFGEDAVTIRCDEARLLDVMRRTFRFMSARPGSRTVGEVEVGRKDGYYLGRWRGDGYRTHATSRIARWVQYRVIECFIEARDDLIWLHGAAAETRGGAVILPGRRGVGKSSLVTELWAGGWTFLTDDILPLEPSTFRALPFPQLPAIRIDPGKDLPDARVPRLPKREVAIAERVASEPLPVAAIVLPHARRGAPATLSPCGPAEVALSLLEGCWNFDRHGQASALEQLATLCEAMPAQRLVFGDPAAAAELVRDWATGLNGLSLPRPANGTL
jgi:hypothetical protein